MPTNRSVDRLRQGRRGLAPEIGNLVRAATDQGWTVDYTATDKLRFRPPSGPPVHIAPNPGDPRGWKNSRTRLRRAGLNC